MLFRSDDHRRTPTTTNSLHYIEAYCLTFSIVSSTLSPRLLPHSHFLFQYSSGSSLNCSVLRSIPHPQRDGCLISFSRCILPRTFVQLLLRNDSTICTFLHCHLLLQYSCGLSLNRNVLRPIRQPHRDGCSFSLSSRCFISIPSFYTISE